MTVYLARSCTAALFYTIATQGAWADLTAKDVWSDWQAYLTSVGYEVAGTESMSGSGMTITDMSISMAVPDSETLVQVDMTELKFVENGDGTVGIMVPSSIPLKIAGTDGGDAFSVNFDYTNSGLAMMATGSPNDVTYTYTATGLEFALASVTAKGQPVPPEVARGKITLSDVAGSTQMQLGEMRNYSQRTTVGSVTYDMAFDNPEGDDMAAANGTVQGLAIEGTGIIPLEMDPENVQKMLGMGMGGNGGFSYASGSSNIQVNADGEQFQMNSTSQGGGLQFGMSAANLVYSLVQKGTAVNVVSNQVPFPIALNMAEVGMNFKFPVTKSDEEQDFAMGFNLSDFTMSDMLWSIFDAGGVLPRDPATIKVDLTGKGKVLVDIFDPAVAEAMDSGETTPGEVNSLMLNDLLISAAGAALSGAGAFTFDNSDLESFDGMPRPAGSVDLKLVGGNALLDKLIQMGFVSEDDAMGARMMMGMLAVPAGEDTLTSKIAINDEGHISANGQRLK